MPWSSGNLRNYGWKRAEQTWCGGWRIEADPEELVVLAFRRDRACACNERSGGGGAVRAAGV